jgi:glycosyltransferase involved in cell wall biosynthesis
MTSTALVIPAWNEAESIGAVLAEVPRGLLQQIMVVVSSTEDPTIAVARQAGTRTLVQPRPGYGAACWSGAQAVIQEGAEVIVFLDGDYSDPPAALPSVLDPILAGRVDLVLGCRDLRHFPHALPAHARAGNWLVRSLVRLTTGHHFTDLPSFKAIRADTLVRLDMREMTYGWTVEMLVKAARLQVPIDEVMVDYRPRLGGQSKVAGSLRGSVGAASRLLACAFAYASWQPAPNPQLTVASGQ